MQIQPIVYVVNPVSQIVLEDSENIELNLTTEKFLVEYLCENTYDTETKKNFKPFVINKITLIMLNLFTELKGKDSFAKKSAYKISLTFKETHFLIDVLHKIFKISCCFRPGKDDEKISELIGPDIKIQENCKVYSHTIELRWAPGNRFLYSDTVSKMPAPLSPNKALSLHIQAEYEYFKGETNQDFTLIVEDYEIPVHTHRLAIQSEYFAKLFESSFKEAKTSEAVIPDHKLHIVVAMIEFIYTRVLVQEFASSIVNLLELTELAHMYQVKSLIYLLESEFSIHAKDHFEKVFEIAVRLDLDRLIKYCLELGECKKECLSIIPKYVTRDNFAILYTIAYESNFSGILQVLDNCRKYNPVLSDLNIQMEK